MGGEVNVISVDKYLSYPIAKTIAPFFYNLGIKPNDITIFNILFRIYLIKKIINNDNSNLLIFFILSHFLDCLDGTIARKYNLKSSIGAKLDHISDKIFWSLLLLLTLKICKNNKNYKLIFFIGIIIFFSIINCMYKKNCFLQYLLENNAILIILLLFHLRKKCINNR